MKEFFRLPSVQLATINVVGIHITALHGSTCSASIGQWVTCDESDL
jgi:hypothetical protein